MLQDLLLHSGSKSFKILQKSLTASVLLFWCRYQFFVGDGDGDGDSSVTMTGMSGDGDGDG